MDLDANKADNICTNGICTDFQCCSGKCIMLGNMTRLQHAYTYKLYYYCTAVEFVHIPYTNGRNE